MYSNLHDALDNGDISAIQHFLAKVIDVNKEDSFGDTLLMKVLRKMKHIDENIECAKYLDIIKLLLYRGADFNREDKKGRTPLYYAIRLKKKDPFELLVKRGADINKEDKDGRTPLYYAILFKKKDLFELLLQRGAYINRDDKDWRTPLYYAIESKNKDLVKLLVQKGADINREDKGGRTPLHMAALYDNKDLIKLLVKRGLDINREDKDGRTPLYYAIESKNKDVVELLVQKGADINRKDKGGRTPLNMAALYDNKDVIELLVKKGANQSRTPLHEACKNNSLPAIELLLSKGADVNAIDFQNRTALHEACKNCDSNVIMHLLHSSKGADVNAIDSYGRTPLMEVVERNFTSGKNYIMHDLIARGANTKLIEDNEGFRLYLREQEEEKKQLESTERILEYFKIRDNSKNSISPNKYEPQYRASDGHMVRSRAELVIDNWLYTNRIFHEYEKYLPTTERVLSDFYLPEQDIYIEFWGLENDSQYNARKKEKLKIYHKYQFRLLELHDSDLLNLEDSLASKLRGFADKKLQKRSYKSDGEMDDARHPFHHLIYTIAFVIFYLQIPLI